MDGCRQLGIHLTSDQAVLFLTYLELLQRWGRKLNLTAIRGEHEMIRRHFLDALTAFQVIEFRSGQRVMDIGSGAGIPGIPIRLIQPAVELTLVEPSQKKAAFLRTVCGKLKLEGVTVLTDTVEKLAEEVRQQGVYDHLLVRALAPTPRRLRAFAGLMKPGGDLLLFQGPKPVDLGDLPPGLKPQRTVRLTLPGGPDQRRLVVLERLARG